MRVKRRRYRFLIAPCAALGLCYAQNAAPVLTLDDALAQARKQNAQIQISTLDISKATEEKDQLKTQRLPIFKLYANVGESLLPVNLTIPMGALGIYPATGPIPAQDRPSRRLGNAGVISER